MCSVDSLTEKWSREGQTNGIMNEAHAAKVTCHNGNDAPFIIENFQRLMMHYLCPVLEWATPLTFSRQHLSFGACLEDKREVNHNWSVLCCVRQLCILIRTHVSSSSFNFGMLAILCFILCTFVRFVICVFFPITVPFYYVVLYCCFCCVGFSLFST